jgi:hypothetical protein
VKPVREPDAGKPHVRFDEEGRETRDGLLGEWTPTRKGGNSGAPPDLYTTALALHSTDVPALVEAIGFVFWLEVGATVLTLVAPCFLPDGTPRSATAAASGEALR